VSPVELLAVSAEDRQLHDQPLPLDGPGSRCRLVLRALPGSEGVQLPCRLAGESRWRFEVAAAGDERLTVDLELDDDGQLHASSEQRAVYTLPADERFAPPPIVRHRSGRRELEVLVVVDGTTRAAGGPGVGSLLLDDGERWPRVADQLVELVAAIGLGKVVRTALLAFGDHTMPMLDAPDLQPNYALWPREATRGELPWFPASDLRARLRAVPSSSGGDFVDALADALALCARLPAHVSAQRVVVLFGDSPGHSLREPAPEGADLLPRAEEIEGPLLELHARGALVVTVFHDRDLLADPSWALRRDLLEHARRQYASVASTPAQAFELSSFDARRVAKAILRPPRLRGRHCCYAVLEEVRGLPARGVAVAPP
jgi:hypothetical protein